MSAPQFTRAQLQEEALSIRRQKLFEKIQEIRTELHNLNKEMVPLKIKVQVANFKLQADRARVTYFTTKIPEIKQEHIDGNVGNEYAMALNAYESYKIKNPEDAEGMRREYAGLLQLRAKLTDQLEQIVAPLKQEAAQSMENVTKYKLEYDTAYDKLQELEFKQYDLVQELQFVVAEDTALNRASAPPAHPGRGRIHHKGTKRRRSTHNKGKKRRRSTHKRKKRHY